MKKRPDGVMLISIYHFIWAALTLLGICALIALPFFVGIVSEGDRDATFWTGFASIIGLVFFGLIFLANLIIGLGLWRMKGWARIAALALSVFRLFNVPVGTIIGGLIIWYLLQENVAAQFES
ncbi:MAG: hypothetical protein H8D78_04705 [Chloroflexi bacterium]|nr:hypothetical protein [Chloroflexota bacterium]